MKDEILLFLQQKQMEQFNKKLYCLHKAFCWAVKFTCAVILYTLANFIITGIFKMLNINVVSLFDNCLSAVNANYSSVVLATSICWHGFRLALCFAIFVSVVWLIISIFVSKALDLGTKAFCSCPTNDLLQRKAVGSVTVSYKHHVAFLA